MVVRKLLGLCLMLFLTGFAFNNSFGQLKSSYKKHDTYQDSLLFFRENGEYMKSLFYFDKLIALSPWSTLNILQKGALLYEQGRYNEAIVEFSNAIKLEPKLIDAYVRRGRSYLSLHLYDSSLNDFNSAYGKFRFQDSTIFLYRAYSHLLKGDLKSAQADVDSSKRFYSTEKTYFNARALVEIEMQDYKRALKDLSMALTIDKNYLESLKNRGIVNYELHNYDDAIKDSQTYLMEYPNDETLNFVVGTILLMKKDYYKVLPYLDKCGKKYMNKQVFFNRGVANYFLANDQKAINDFYKALKLYPTREEQGRIYALLGICKNNVKSQTGCQDLLKAIELGFDDFIKDYSAECK